MNQQKISRISRISSMVLSLLALFTVLSGFMQPPQSDEGTGAHIFQLSIVALVPILVLFLATAEWKKPLQTLRLLAAPAVVLVLAFSSLYCLEHYR